MAIPAVKAKVWLLHLKHSSLSTNIIREISSYLIDLQLAQVTATFLRFFNCHTSAWGPQVLLHSPITADQNSTWVVLKDGRVFCSGEGRSQAGDSNGWSVSYLLSWDGTVEQLPSMLTARHGHGIIQVQQIYTFGGCKL